MEMNEAHAKAVRIKVLREEVLKAKANLKIAKGKLDDAGEDLEKRLLNFRQAELPLDGKAKPPRGQRARRRGMRRGVDALAGMAEPA